MNTTEFRLADNRLIRSTYQRSQCNGIAKKINTPAAALKHFAFWLYLIFAVFLLAFTGYRRRIARREPHLT